MPTFIFLITMMLLPMPALATAGDLPAALTDGGIANVTDIVDGDTVILDNGREVRLVGIQAPKLPLGRPDFQKWPLADEAKKTLADLILGQRVRLAYGGREEDRYGRRLAHLYTLDGRWLQGELLERGMARVYSFSDNRALIAQMLDAEERARVSRQGIWQHRFYTVLDHQSAAKHIGEYALVEGVVMDNAVVRGRGYLNFGADYRTDFTISIAPRDLKRFPEAERTLDGFRGLRVRVRGWLEWRNGPMINLTHPEQIEVLPQ